MRFFLLSVPKKIRGYVMKSSIRARSYSQCFICRHWSSDAGDAFSGTTLCLPCYVDVLEGKQARGVLQTPEREGPVPGERPGPEANHPSPFTQLDLFDS